MGETIPTWKPTCNPSVSVQLSGRKTSCDGGAFLLREVMDRSGIFERLEQKLQDDRDPLRVRHSLISQLRTLIIQHAQGWDDLSDTQLLSEDPVFQLACSDQRSTTPLAQQRPSQPTLSRLLNLLAQDTNLNPLHEGLLDLAMWRSEEHTSELQSRPHLVCRLLLEKKNKNKNKICRNMNKIV